LNSSTKNWAAAPPFESQAALLTVTAFSEVPGELIFNCMQGDRESGGGVTGGREGSTGRASDEDAMTSQSKACHWQWQWPAL
jgi:hypothetical protein